MVVATKGSDCGIHDSVNVNEGDHVADADVIVDASNTSGDESVSGGHVDVKPTENAPPGINMGMLQRAYRRKAREWTYGDRCPTPVEHGTWLSG